MTWVALLRKNRLDLGKIINAMRWGRVEDYRD